MARISANGQNNSTTHRESPPPSPISAASPSFSDSSVDEEASSFSENHHDALGPSASRPSSPAFKLHPETLQSEDSVTCQWEDCGQVFTHLPSLIEHIHNDHIGVHKSNYTCEWASCQRRGLPQTSRFALISHIRSHTGEKPFLCTRPECDKSFTRSDALAKHMRLQHNISPPAPGRGGSRKRKRVADDQGSGPAPPAPHASSPAPSMAGSSSGFNTFKVEPNTPSESLDDHHGPQDYFARPPATNGRHKSTSPRPASPGNQPPDDDEGYTSSSSDTLPSHLLPHFEPSTGLVLGRPRSMVMYLLMKAKHHYALEQHEQLCEELRVVRAELKKERDEKEGALNMVLRSTFGLEADSLIAPLQPPPGVDITEPEPPAIGGQHVLPVNGNGR